MQINKNAYLECNCVNSWRELLDRQYPAMEGNWLDLKGCQLGDEQGVALLEYLQKKPIKFRVIDLSDNNITDITANKIAEVIRQMPSFCSSSWLGNMIKVVNNPISIVGLRTCFAAMRVMERQPDLIVFSHNETISAEDWNALNAEYQEMKKKQDPIVRFFTWLNSFFAW